MRPLRLKVKSFTAFRDEQEIDLEELGVFAIAGPTGSGKSSLLDAMTFALYGYVERVGKQVGQLVSQGQPRMAVTLEFLVGDRRYRVTRSTPAAKGQTKILLQRLEDDEWVQAGEGADRVRDCDALIRGVVGLDYTAFTRSVLLPQGKFAEFLVGDPKQRREILVDLLGLSRYRRMGEEASRIAREESTKSAVNRDRLDRDYEGVSAEAVAEARRQAKEAQRREGALAKAGETVDGLLRRWEDACRSAGDLRRCADEAGHHAATARDAGKVLEEVAGLAGEVGELVAAHWADGERAAAALAEAETALERAEREWGRAPQVAALRARAQSLASERARSRRALLALAQAEKQGPELVKAVAGAEAAASEGASRAGLARQALRDAEGALEELRHADQVADLVAELAPGDPCPVCGAPLETIPSRPGDRELAAARRLAAGAKQGLEEAERDVRDLERSRDGAVRDLEELHREAERLAGEAVEHNMVVAESERLLTEALGELPPDPEAELARRLEALEGLATAHREAGELVRRAEAALREVEAERDGLAARVGEERARLGFATKPLLDRARAAGGKELRIPRLPTAPTSHDPAVLAEGATGLASALEALGSDLETIAARRLGLKPELLAQAHDTVGDLLPPASDLASLATALVEGIRHAGAKAAAAEERAASLGERLEKRRALEEEIRAGEARAAVFKTLSNELRADRFIDFLLREALAVLAAGASKRLATLSDGRYRLECRADEFYVVDTWNGDEKRSVRTLSGGETFLASLALALALSEQVRSLSVTERARLDSLFLDEGFGTLDPETLKVVIEAIEQLGGDGRLVGIITHVPALAEEFPRFEVTKTPRGSHVAFVG